MHWAIVYCKWKATWWMSQKTRREDLSEDLAEGLCAYASEQAISERHCALNWQTSWAAARALAKETTKKLTTSASLVDGESFGDEENMGADADAPSLAEDFDDDDGLCML
ncbi:hypothetical protein JAAARDRAFT_47246 [Jaapia argillacea MUCL 33604]|uniref:Uncharacterized protein n=1 Tax=Jaapia argillacea MUCL 33604 TaxID=933084 RepID=A0A067Q616_9AGAM|nr:hypothetical protein JAAARDRAFT_47246 [Jaapia argillacea MUCL 33604]